MVKLQAEATEVQEEEEAPLHGDILQRILSHVPLIDLVPATHVSKTWRTAVSSSLSNYSSIKPWFMLHIQSPRNPALTTTYAYDPRSHVWIEITHAQVPYTSTLRSSHSNLLYMISPTKFRFSYDPLNHIWHDVDAPRVWRSDPLVAVIGPHVVIAGGTCDFEDDPLAVEMFNIGSGRWEVCQPMPAILKYSAATTWLSVAVSDKKMFLLEKNSSIICSFDPMTKKWEGAFHLHLNPSVFFSVIRFSGDRLVLAGLVGDPENIESLRLWEVMCDSLECKGIGKMPSVMLEDLKNSANSSLSSIGVSTAKEFIYIYNPSNPAEIFFCELNGGGGAGICKWGSIKNPIVNDRNRINRFIFTCSNIGINELEKNFWSGKTKFAVRATGK